MNYRLGYLLTFLMATNANSSDNRPECTPEQYTAYKAGETRISQDEYDSLQSKLADAFGTRTGASEMPQANEAVAICGACKIGFRQMYANNIDKACYAAVNRYIDVMKSQGGHEGGRPLAIPANIPDRTPLDQDEAAAVLGGAAGAAGGAQKVGN